MNNADRRDEMKRAVRYKSGPGLVNTIYLGSMATAGIVQRLGGNYGADRLSTLIDSANDSQFEAAWNYEGFQWILKHYRNGGSKLYKFKVTAEEIE